MNLLKIFSKDNAYRTQVFYLVLTAFFGLLSYPFTQTSAAPYFNAAYGADNLSWAMIASAILCVVVVSIYNRLAKQVPLIPLCIYAMALIVLITILFGFMMGNHPKWMALVYYAWSDVYILILVEQFWSMSNTLFDKAAAKSYYGLFLASSAVGSLLGNMMVKKLSIQLGSDNMIFFCALALIASTFCITLFNQSISDSATLSKRFNIEHYLADSSSFGGATLVIKSSYLTLIALLVVATQLYINGTYFIYNRILDASTSHVEAQSAVYAGIFFYIQLATIFWSFIITPLSLKYLGVSKTHFTILGIIAVVFGIATMSPHLVLVALLFVLAKSFDYSIFRAAREIFYLPLHVAEKFQAKAFIDVFLYRFSKAIAAFGIILIGTVLHISIMWLVAFGIIAWLVLIIFILKRYKQLSKEHPL